MKAYVKDQILYIEAENELEEAFLELYYQKYEDIFEEVCIDFNTCKYKETDIIDHTAKEVVFPVPKENCNYDKIKYSCYYCSEESIKQGMKYCPGCGAVIKWKEYSFLK